MTKQRFKGQPGEDEAELPIFARTVEKIPLDEMEKVITARQWASWSYNKKYFLACTIREVLRDAGMTDVEAVEADLSDADIQALLMAGLIRPTSWRGMIVGVKLFTSAEWHKWRRRLITWPQAVNELTEGDENPQFATYEDTFAKLAYRYGAVLDVKSMYHHFATADDYGDLMTFTAGCPPQRYALTSVPTGERHVPGLAQAWAASIVEKVVQIVNAEGQGEIAGEAYIDNFRFVGDELRAVQRAVAVFRDIMRQMKVAINETDDEVNQQLSTGIYEYLGVEYNHQAKTCRIAKKTRTRLAEARELLANYFTKNAPVSWQQTQAIFGSLSWVSCVLALDLSKYYYIYKFLRRRCAQGYMDDEDAGLWKCTRELWLTWIDEATTHTRSFYECRGPATHVFSDASKIGYGVVVVRPNGTVSVFGGPWEPKFRKRHINELEAEACIRAITEVNIDVNDGPTHIHLHVDNTTAIAVQRRRRSRNYFLNKRVGELLNIAEKRKFIIKVSYIRSEHNPSDVPSRMTWFVDEVFDLQDMQKIANSWTSQQSSNTGNGEEIQE